jgi:hypothetical protein
MVGRCVWSAVCSPGAPHPANGTTLKKRYERRRDIEGLTIHIDT